MTRLLASFLLFHTACGATIHQDVTQSQISRLDPTLSSLSAGVIGCPPNEIQISDYQTVVRTIAGDLAGETSTWSARCRGRQFYCTGASITQCHESIVLPAPTGSFSH